MAPAVAPFQLVYDCDPGIDDTLALAIVADGVRSGRVDLAAVVAVGGNVGLDHTAGNVGFLASRFGLDVPTFSGASEPRLGGVPGDASEVHGSDGLGGLRRDDGWSMPTAATPQQLVDVVAGLDPDAGPHVLLATGPVTNLAAMIDIDPGLGRRVDRVIVMGGAFGDPGGNVTAHAEFNVWVDPEAWAVIAGADLPLEVVPLDVTTKVVLRRDDLATVGWNDGDDPTLVAAIVAAGIELYDDLLGTPFCEMHDPLAAALLFRPELVRWTTGPVSVLLDGGQRGRTVLGSDGASSRTRVALGVDIDAARAALLGALAAVTDR